MKRIILSTDHNPVYAWFVPLCTLMWREVAGFEVSCIFVGPVSPWIRARALEVGTSLYECPGTGRVAGGAAGQLMRLFSYLIPGVAADDYLVAVDSDAWPLARVFDPTGAAIDLIYPDACDNDANPYFPIGYIGATATVWSEFMGIAAASPEAAAEELFRVDSVLAGGHSGWNYDQTLVTAKIKAWRGWPDAVHIRRRPGDPPVDRLDRAAWPAAASVAGKIDAHLLRPGWTNENWPRLRHVLAQCLSSTSLAWVDRYRAEWLQEP